MRRGFLLAALLPLLAACSPPMLISPYDEQLDSGLREYRESVNVLVKDAAMQGGTKEGTFDAYASRYHQLEARIDGLIQRTAGQSQGLPCKLPKPVTDQLMKVLASHPNAAEFSLAAQKESGRSEGCTLRLVQIVKEQLDLLEQIHKTTDKCASSVAGDPSGTSYSCLRSATKDVVLKITNQSIDAAWYVEIAKKKGEAS
ncbi:MAG: hypothetical protein QM756_18830 [Polyangiaceae bacterium]